MKIFPAVLPPQSAVLVFDVAFVETLFATGLTRRLNVKTAMLFIEIIIQQQHSPAVPHKALVVLDSLPSSLMNRSTVAYSTGLLLAPPGHAPH
jgi:hypothetical protein